MRVTDVNQYELSLAWDIPEFNGGSKVTGYTVEMRSLMDNKYRGLRTLDGTATTHTAVGLTEGTEYYFRLRAKNDAGVGEPVELSEPIATKAPYSKFFHTVSPPPRLRTVTPPPRLHTVNGF